MSLKAAIYGRVSTDHDEQQESVKVQKDALMQFAKTNMINIAGCYFDEGYTGTNFERPELLRLRRDIDAGLVDTVIIKDLSRLGRNNTLTLLFLDYLHEKNVRLIALNDDYDTLKDDDDLIGIKTWVNERYSKELSRKIKFALRHKKKTGEYLAAFAPYGYKKSLVYKNKLEVDDYSSQVIKEIFRLYIEGNGFGKIAEILESRGVLNPSRYGFYGRRSEKWDSTTVRRIITNPVYTGDSVQQRYCKKTYKSKKVTKAPESAWIEVKNTHEPIISRETFILAREILDKRKGKPGYRNGQCNPHIFNSFLFCHECGSALYYKKDKTGKGAYRCGGYVKYGRKYCSTHFVSEEEMLNKLRDILVFVIKENIDFDMLSNDIASENISNKCTTSKRKLVSIEDSINKNCVKLETIYRDRLNGIIDETLYIKIKNELESLNFEQHRQKNSFITQASKYELINDRSFLKNKIEEILSMENGVDRHILERYVKRIEVCHNGEIIINFNFFL